MPVQVLIELRRDTAANWTGTDPVLAEGEPGYETDTGQLKFGDGSTSWTSLPYFDPTASSWGGAADALFSGSGSPVGSVTPDNEGDLYVDTATPGLWQATGATSADWTQIGAAVTAREQLISGTVTSIPDGDNDFLYWDTKVSGDDLLDLTDPQQPTIVSDGVYAVTVSVECAPLTVGGYYIPTLTLNAAGDNGNVFSSSPPSVTADQTPGVALSLTYFVPAGGQVIVTVSNFDGVSAVDFFLQAAVIQRIS